MSLEDTIALAATEVGLARDEILGLVDVAQTQIDRVGAAYEDHIDRLRLTFYVSATGSDTAPGDEQDPLATIKKAVDICPVGGVCHIRLLSDIHVNADIMVEGKHIHIEADGSQRYRLSFEHYEIVSNSTEYSRLYSFNIISGGSVSVRDLTLVIPGSDANFANNQYGAHATIFRCSSSNVAQGAFTSVAIIDCDVERPVGSLISIFGRTSSATLALSVRSVVETDQALAGYWIEGIAAATDPATLPHVLTSLTSL